MTFEDDFPSLEKYDNKPSDDYDFIFSRNEVMDSCLDKVRVREAILKYQCTCNKFSLSQCIRCNILDDLGIEEK